MLILNMFVWFTLTSVVVGPLKGFLKRKHEIEDELNRAKMFHLGFMDPPIVQVRKKYETSLNTANLRLKSIYKTLQCGYALFAMRYLQMIEGLLADPIILVQKDYENVLFHNEGAAMLAASIHDTDLNGVKNAMWAFWLYADRLHRFLESTEKSAEVDMQKHSAICTAHRAVYAVLDRFLTLGECIFYNVKEKLRDLTEQIVQITNGTDKLNSLIALILDTKKVFDEQNFTNSNLGVLATGQQDISMRKLSLNGLLGIQTVVVRSMGTGFWENIKNWLSHEYNMALDLGVTLSTQAKSLIVFQKKFIDTINLITLHFGRQFLMATANADHLINHSLDALKIKVYAELVNLDQLVDIESKQPMDETMALIINCIRTCQTDSVQVSKTAGVEELDNKITDILSKSVITSLVLSDFSAHNDENSGIDPYEFHEYPIEQIQLFVKNAREALSDVNFNMVNSFLEYTSSDESQYVDTIENA